MQNKNLVFISLFVVVALFIAAIYFYKGSVSNSRANIDEILLKDYSYKKGENKKSIVVVEFIDPQCGSCAAFHPLFKKLYKEYSDDILIVTKYLANHKNSKIAIEMLEASREQNLYDEVLDVIFENFLGLNQTTKSQNFYGIFLKEVTGLDIMKLKTDMKSPKISEIIKQDKADGSF